VTDKKTRTALQNRSIHMYFKLLAYELNEAGFDVMKTMSHDIEIPWNEHLVKELIWRKVQKVMTDKRSTTRLDTSEISQIYEVINKHIAQTTGVHVPFPDNYSLSLGE